MGDNGVRGLTPRTVEVLLEANEELARQVRARIPHSPRPVFLYYVEQSLDTVRANLTRGADPRPRTPAQQLCWHLMIAHAEQRTPSLDTDLIRLRRALLTDADVEPLLGIGGAAGSRYDFVALGDALTPDGMSAFFDPGEPGDLVA